MLEKYIVSLVFLLMYNLFSIFRKYTQREIDIELSVLFKPYQN